MKKKTSNICKFITAHTCLADGVHHYYPSLYTLHYLIEKIIELNETTDYIKFNPFYMHPKTGMREFDDNMCYIECCENVTDDSKEDFLIRNLNDDETLESACRHYALIDITDTAGFQKALTNYLTYIEEIIPTLAETVRNEYALSETDLLYGYFGFEIYAR